MNALLMVYWLGWGLERMNAKPELGQAEGAGLSKGAGQAKGESQQSRAKGAVLLLLAAVLALGCLSYSPDGAESYGPQNMASGSAVRSLITGEAKRYDQDMDLRDAAMNDPTLTQVQLSPVSTVPKVFMTDALDSDSLDYVLSLYAEYYDKISVTVSEKE